MKFRHGNRWIISVLLGGMLLIIASLRHPGRLPGAPGFDPLGRIHGFFAYAYHFTRSQWTGNRDPDPAARRAAALAAWHRPAMTRQLLRIAPDDYPALAREYASLGLGGQAAHFFRRAFPDAVREEEGALEIISYLAILGDWTGVRDLSGRVLEADAGSFEANYWRGRSLVETGNFDQALPFLDQAHSLNPSAGDTLYQQGRAFEGAGEKHRALALYEEAAERSPNHRAAGPARNRLGASVRPGPGRQDDGSATGEPALPATGDLNFENRFVLLGYSAGSSQLSTGDAIAIEVSLQGWGFRPAAIQPVILFRDRIGRRALKVLPPVETGLQGEVTRESLTCRVPEHLAPGTVKIMLFFRDPESKRRLGLNNTAEDHVTLAELNLQPGWIASSLSGRSIRRRFGPGAKALGKKTYLTDGSRLRLDLSGDVPVSALGIVSGVICPTRCRNSLFQGRVVAEITAEGKDGGRTGFPIILGRDTADIHWDLPGATAPRHEKAPIFNSRTAKWREPYFPAHQYCAVYRLPEPAKLSSLLVEGRGDGLVLQVSDLILIAD